MGASRNRPSADPLSVVAKVLQNHLPPASRVCAALSGGLDSVVLLHILHRLMQRHDFALCALHVNHQISPNAESWTAFCERLCEGWGIELTQTRVSVSAHRGTGVEAAARAERYRAFAGVNAGWIALAHHRDDQAETVLLNLVRGSGMRGIAAMPEARPLVAGGPLLLRPLLGLSRGDLEVYALDQGLSWIEDESNRDTRLRRNFIRHRVLPLIEDRFPGCRETLARGAAWAAEASVLLEELAAADAMACLDAQRRLDLGAVERLSAARVRNLLRHWMALSGLRMPDSERLAAIQMQLGAVGAGQRIRIDIEGGVIRCYRGWASIEPRDGPTYLEALQWQGEACLDWGAGSIRFRETIGDGLSRRALAAAPVVVRPRQGGERMRLDARRPRRTLKNLWQEAGIPPWQRSVMPLLWCGEHLAWVPGVGIAWEFRCAHGEPGVSPCWEH